MILNIRNWGAVGEVSIDTARPLVVMCGPNSTGKTYVSYLLYALFSKLLRSQEYLVNVFDLPLGEDIKSSVVSGCSFELTEKYFAEILEATALSIKDKLAPLIFAISEDMAKTMFHDFDLEIRLGQGEFECIAAKAMFSKWKTGNYTIGLNKKANSKTVSVEIEHDEDDEINSIERVPYLNKLIPAFLLELIFDHKGFSRMLTVERNSVYTFSKELALNRSFGMGDLVAIKSSSETTPPERYPMAVTDSLKIAVDLPQVEKNRGYFYEYASRLERNLLNGDIEINKNGAVEFVPDLKSERRRRLPIQMTSSIVKTMSSLILYLKHLASRNDILIIDEPEMNLHPDNQRLITRIFTELVNKGLNIVVSTHSDYIIREFNNLIMAYEIAKRNIKLEEGEEIPYTRQQMLDRKDVEVLYFNVNAGTEKVIGRELPVSEFGFDVESIDATILAQNSVTHNLADILKYGEPNE